GVAGVGEALLVGAGAALLEHLARPTELGAQPIEDGELLVERFDLCVDRVDGAVGGLFAAVRCPLELEQRLDLVEREAGGAHVRDELEALELAEAAEPVPSRAAAIGLEDLRLLVEAHGAQGV